MDRCKDWPRDWAAFDSSVDLVYATATDVPFLEPRWITRLVELSDGYDWSFPMWRDITIRWRPSIDRPQSCRRSTAYSVRSAWSGSVGRSVKTRVVDETELRMVDPALRYAQEPELSGRLRASDLPTRGSHKFATIARAVRTPSTAALTIPPA